MFAVVEYREGEYEIWNVARERISLVDFLHVSCLLQQRLSIIQFSFGLEGKKGKVNKQIKFAYKLTIPLDMFPIRFPFSYFMLMTKKHKDYFGLLLSRQWMTMQYLTTVYIIVSG